MAYHRRLNALLVAGGFHLASLGVIARRDAGWTSLPGSPEPSARYLTDVAYDVKRDVLVLFGGGDPTGWRSTQTPGSSTARRGGAFAKNDSMLHFGMTVDPLSDAKIIDSWHKNAAPWTAAVRDNQIESRRLVTNQAIVDAIRQSLAAHRARHRMRRRVARARARGARDSIDRRRRRIRSSSTARRAPAAAISASHHMRTSPPARSRSRSTSPSPTSRSSATNPSTTCSRTSRVCSRRMER